MRLYAPIEWWESTKEQREKNCNGCGSELDLSGKLVPNTMYGLDVMVCCCVHDFMYLNGTTLGDKLFADSMFLLNLTLLIIKAGGFFMLLRLLRATKYFVAVVKAGDKSFFDGKPINEELNITFKGNFRELEEIK